MSGSSLDGLDIAYAELEETGGNWSYAIKAASCIAYDDEWIEKLRNATELNAYDYLLLDSAYGKFIGEKVNDFIAAHDLYHKVQLIASHGHTVFHAPKNAMTAQLGNGATIAALTGINVVSDLRIMDIALGGQGAPIVPVGEKLLLNNYDYFLNLGGIANISANLLNTAKTYIAFDVCPANRVLNLLANKEGKPYDDKGETARSGAVNTALLRKLNDLDYYKQPYPKSLANYFGTDIVYPLVESFYLSTPDALRTYTEHVVQQVVQSISVISDGSTMKNKRMLVTGGGAFNEFLTERLRDSLAAFGVDLLIADQHLVKYKEALIMGLIGVLRWREEDTVMNSVTGASRNSIGGAVWMGLES
jgi:anhydro-N-acetylmuramic acid kinase